MDLILSSVEKISDSEKIESIYMKMPVGKLSGQALDSFFEESIKYHIDIFTKKIAEYEPTNLYSAWRTIVRSIDEMINIPLELEEEKDSDLFLKLSFDIRVPKNILAFKKVAEMLETQFEQNVSERFKQFVIISHAINKTYEDRGIFQLLESGFNLAQINQVMKNLV